MGGPAGTHPVQGDAASLLCPPEYHDLSAADGADCTTVPFHAGECADHGTHDHGDSLHFMWEGNHNVYRMANKLAFEECDFTGATNIDSPNLVSISPVEHKLTELPAYFACEIEGHCAMGQKLAVTAEM